MTKEKVIYSKWLAIELRKQGFKILRTEINSNYPQYDCWVFEKTKEFDSALAVISTQKK